MSVELELTPKTKRPAGERCCEPVVYPDVERDEAIRMARSPRRSATPSACSSSTCCASTPARCACASSCPCSTSPSRPCRTTSRCCATPGSSAQSAKGLWAYYYVIPDALKELSAWLS